MKSHSHFYSLDFSTSSFFVYAVFVHIFEFVVEPQMDACLHPIILSTAFIIPAQRHSGETRWILLPVPSASLTLSFLQLLPATEATLLSLL